MAETYVLDTNILVGYIRDAPYSRFIDDKFAPFEGDNFALVSIVTHGELFSLAYQLGWGKKKRAHLRSQLSEVSVLNIDYTEIIDCYAEIDAYSQGKLKGKPLGTSSRNMGKNDLWIAATASVTEASLLTTDKDFNHLDGEYLDVQYVDPDADY
jgi:predicted nucleic acid-binding protein